jgi:sec-independent protein translocase protein TatB
MLREIGATELLVIAAVALIVVGPKDLPLLLRKLGQWMAKARGMANEFRASFDEMARQSELDELRREVQALRTGQFMDPRQTTDGARDAGVDKSIHRELKILRQVIFGIPFCSCLLQGP